MSFYSFSFIPSPVEKGGIILFINSVGQEPGQGRAKMACLCPMMLGSHWLMAPIFYSISKYGLRIITKHRNANYLVLP